MKFLFIILFYSLTLVSCNNTLTENPKMNIMNNKISSYTPKLLSLVDYNNPILRQKTSQITFPLNNQDKQLILDMKYSITTFESAAGMAANQWGANKSIFLFSPEDDFTDRIEVIINPSYEPIKEANSPLPKQEINWESCFSIPLAAGKVKRYTHIKVKYQDENGNTIIKELKDWPARVWQHENDHLNGILYDDQNIKKCEEKKVFSSTQEMNDFYKSLKNAQ